MQSTYKEVCHSFTNLHKGSLGGRNVNSHGKEVSGHKSGITCLATSCPTPGSWRGTTRISQTLPSRAKGLATQD